MTAHRRTSGALTGASLLVAALCAPAGAQAPTATQAAPAGAPAPEEQLAAAVQAAPEDRRADVTVLGWDGSGGTVVLRSGSNDLVCLADDPAEEGWSVACYHESLEPFMARGRELRQQGIGGMEVNEIRYREIEEETLPFPRVPATLYVLHGAGWDAERGEVREPYLRWVVYTPFATPESTGLSTRASEGAPWLMFPGTAGAHIMITPARGEGERTEG